MEKFSFLAPEAVKNHPTNCSPSKALYRFSNSKRFKPANPECPTAFYSNLSGLSQRQTSIGFGKKLDFTKPAMITPSGSDYNPDIKWMKQGKTFGCSRDKSLDRSYIPPQIQSHPGVGAYVSEKSKNYSVAFSMRAKTICIADKYNTAATSPGPGAYEGPNLQPREKKIYSSKYKCPKMGTLRLTANRFQVLKDLPGPQAYHEGDSLSPDARYLLSHHRGNGKRVFDRERKFSCSFWKPSDNPGPADYDKPSDFGLYGDAHYYQHLSTAP